MEPPPCQIDGVVPMVKVAEEKGVGSALLFLTPGKTRLMILAACLTGAEVHGTAGSDADEVVAAVAVSWRAAGVARTVGSAAARGQVAATLSYVSSSSGPT
jgi:hypothetical protein